MDRELPIYAIEGTDFIVDVANLQLRERENAQNTIRVFDMRDLGDGYVFDYNPQIKNISEQPSELTGSVVVKIPELVKLDPQGMAEKYGYNIHQIQNKTDFDVMVDQQALGRRLMGQLPTIDIAGHTFFVEVRLDKLQPKDDFLSNGIVFSQIDHYYNDEREVYMIPYNPKTREFQELDHHNITAIPKDLIAISFPHESELDPIAYNRKGGWDETFGLKETNLKSHFEAKTVDWKETGIEETIQQNIKRLRQQKEQPTENYKKGNRVRRRPKL